MRITTVGTCFLRKLANLFVNSECQGVSPAAAIARTLSMQPLLLTADLKGGASYAWKIACTPFYYAADLKKGCEL